MSPDNGFLEVRGAQNRPFPLPHHEALIATSAISPEVAQATGYRSVTTKSELERLGFSKAQRCTPALLIPIWGVTGKIVSCQIRPDEPRIVKGKAIKYETPSGSSMVLDLPRAARDWLGNPKRPLCTIVLLGVWNWRDERARRQDRTEDPHPSHD